MGIVMPVMYTSWKLSRPIRPVPTLPVMATIGTLSMYAVAMPVTRFVAPGPLVASTTPVLAGGPRIAVRRVRRALLVGRHDMRDLVAGLVQRVVQIQHRAARIAEQRVHALLQQHLHKDVCAG